MGGGSSGAASVTAAAVDGGEGRKGDLGGEPASTADDPGVGQRPRRACRDRGRRPRAASRERLPSLSRRDPQSRGTTPTRGPAGETVVLNTPPTEQAGRALLWGQRLPSPSPPRNPTLPVAARRLLPLPAAAASPTPRWGEIRRVGRGVEIAAAMMARR